MLICEIMLHGPVLARFRSSLSRQIVSVFCYYSLGRLQRGDNIGVVVKLFKNQSNSIAQAQVKMQRPEIAD